MYDEKRELIATLPGRTRHPLRARGQVDDAPTSSSSNGTDWSIVEIVCHLLDSEHGPTSASAGSRTRRPAVPLFPDDAYAAGGSTARLPC